MHHTYYNQKNILQLIKIDFGFVQDIEQNTMVKTHKYQEFENHKSTCRIICFGKNFLDIPNHTIKDPFILEFFQTQKMHSCEVAFQWTSGVHWWVVLDHAMANLIGLSNVIHDPMSIKFLVMV